MLLPALPALGADGQPPVPFPRVGELYYYSGVAQLRSDGEPQPWEVAQRFVAAEEVVDRTGARRLAYVVEQVRPGYDWQTNTVAFHGSADALLDDPRAVRFLAFHDVTTFELLEVRSAGSGEGEVQTGLEGLPVAPLQSTYRSAGRWREWFDAGLRDPYAPLWGAPLPDGQLALTFVEGSSFLGMGHATGLYASELAGLFAGLLDLPRSYAPPRAVEVTLDPLARGDVGGRDALGFRGTSEEAWGKYVVRTTRELWFADGLALPARERLDTVAQGRTKTYATFSDVSLAEHRAGRAELPWGEELREGAFAPELGAFARWGPADGTAGLAYPLPEAVAAVRADPTVAGFQAMELRGDPVLVKAFYEVRDHPDRPVREARWLLMFHDARGDEVIVESKRPHGMPLAVSVNREQASRGAYILPDIEGVTPQELPRAGPTLGGAARAWERFRLAEAPGVNAVVFSLQRMRDGSVLPIVWAGWSREQTELGAEPSVTRRVNYTLVGVDLDGLPRMAIESAYDSRSEVEPLAASSAGPAAPAALPGPAPVLAAAGVGVAALAGLALKLLGPLYTRLDRAKVVGHPARRALLQLLEREPGVHLEAAQRALGVGAGTLAHHVGILERAGLLRVQRAGRFRRLYPAALNGQAALRDAALRPPRSAALHKLVTEHPGVGLREAARLLGVPASSLQWHVARLEQAGLVERRAGALHPRPA